MDYDVVQLPNYIYFVNAEYVGFRSCTIDFPSRVSFKKANGFCLRRILLLQKIVTFVMFIFREGEFWAYQKFADLH